VQQIDGNQCLISTSITYIQVQMENVEKAKALAAAQRTLEGVVAKALEVRRKVEERELHRAG
jgi:hypothetical protein